MKIFGKIIAAMVLALCGALGAQAQLPSVQVKDLSGKPVDTATLSNGGKPFIISFWATWCKLCRRELQAIADQYADWVEETGVKLYAVSVDKASDTAKVKPVVDAGGWEYEVLLDPSGDFQRAMGASNVPHVIIVDGQGKVVESHGGYTEGSEEELIEKVRELIKGK